MRRFKQTIVLNTEPPRRNQQQGSAWVLFWCCALLGLGFIVPGLLSLSGLTVSSGGDAWMTIAIGAALAGPLLYYGLRWYIARHVTRCLIPEWQLRERLNADYTTLSHAMSRSDVRPRFIVDGKRYYSRSDFGEIASLLRASSTPLRTQEVLLRPATDVERPTERLLRPTEAMQESGTEPSPIHEARQTRTQYGNAQQSEGTDINRHG